MKSSQVPLKNLPMVGTTMVGHIHIMIIELLMKLDVILKNVGCTVTKMLDHNTGKNVEDGKRPETPPFRPGDFF